ncbi:MAG TPA: DUF192 domain-containing protein [Candidatus Bipolaricaulota bacterium]|nr:DUF192 domain-containing protein [Candidatus Bipolaricaulota bacterium]
MKKFCSIFFLILTLAGCSKNAQVSNVCFDQTCFNVEVADSGEAQERGLMFREKLESNQGMFFVFDEEDIYSLWMKNTLIPLDMIWLDENLKIVSIFSNAQPCQTPTCESIKPLKKAKYILEINGGAAVEKGIDLHQVATFK